MICFENFLRPFAMFRPKTGFCVQNTNFLAVLHSFVIHRNWTQKHKTHLHRPRPATMMVDHFDVSHSFFSPFFFFCSRFPNCAAEFRVATYRVCAFANPSASGVDCSWVRWNLDRQRPQKRTKSLCKIFPTHTGFSLFSFSPSHRLFFIEEKIFSTLALSLSRSHSHTRAWKKTFFLREITRGAPHTFQETIRAAG